MPDVLFSIIVPAYNAANHIERCLNSLFAQTINQTQFEIIVIDDCSQDHTLALLNAVAQTHPSLKVAASTQNGGPGQARNIGLDIALGEWVLFVDSDDALQPNALESISLYLKTQTNTFDAIGYQWGYADSSGNTQDTTGRKDSLALQLDKSALLKEYLALRMDGSVIYTAMRLSVLKQHQLRFANGYHEDVDFIYKVYCLAQQIGYIKDTLYLKTNRENSIVNSVSSKHILGFLRAWKAIASFTQQYNPTLWQDLKATYIEGLFGVVATRLREVIRHVKNDEESIICYQTLYDGLQADFAEEIQYAPPPTQYGMIAKYFIETTQNAQLLISEKAQNITQYIKETLNKTWSCTDLHHSVFLAPDEIRTCCKRFFVDGEIRGDVALIKIPNNQIIPVSPIRILKEKQQLHLTINQGKPSACSGCPFLEFKEWGPLDKLDVRYLSFEYHSVCNLKCNYCSDTYFGGKQAHYDVKALVDKMLDGHMLDQCGTIVWGGGEPVVGKHFNEMLEKTVTQIPKATQRVLTNSVKHSPIVQRYLQDEKVSVTTSIDAGTEDTFTKVRGMTSLKKVIKNLKRYASANANQVTIKYIFTEGNDDIAEVRAFVAMMQDHQLIDCNFQISCDFKHESIAINTVISMIALYGMLTDAQCRLVFFDDLLRQRLGEAHTESESTIRSALKELGLGHILADKHAYQKVAIWGAGWQSKNMIEQAAFFKEVAVDYFIDSRPSRIGEHFMNHEIKGPESLLDSDIPVVIAAVQSLPIIYQSFVDLGLDKSRLIKQLII